MTLWSFTNFCNSVLPAFFPSGAAACFAVAAFAVWELSAEVVDCAALMEKKPETARNKMQTIPRTPENALARLLFIRIVLFGVVVISLRIRATQLRDARLLHLHEVSDQRRIFFLHSPDTVVCG